VVVVVVVVVVVAVVVAAVAVVAVVAVVVGPFFPAENFNLIFLQVKIAPLGICCTL